MRRFENVYYRGEIFNLLREVPSEKFFNVVEHLLKIVYRIVHIRIAIPDDIILNPSAGNKRWSRKESVRDRHIHRFKGAVDMLNCRLSQNKAKYRYQLDSEFIQMVKVDTELDVPKEDSSIEKKDNTQTPEHHQNQSRSEFWNRKLYIITFVAVILAALIFFFGDGILIGPLRWGWNYLQTPP